MNLMCDMDRPLKKENILSNSIIGAAIEVHRQLGPGLLESTYEACLCHELALQDISFVQQKSLPVSYKGFNLDCAYRLDLLIEDIVIVEIKSIQQFEPIHSAQLLTYLKLARKKLGILVNFNTPVLKNGIKRIVNNL